MVLILETVAAAANYICIVLFVLQNAVIKIIDFVLEHNKGLEEKMYRRTFDKANQRAEKEFKQHQKDFESFQNEFDAEYRDFIKGAEKCN